jgi:hypothetical protein
MNIIIHPDCKEVANVGIVEIAVILNEKFGKYEQSTTLEETEKVCHGPVVLPIMAFGPLQILLKSKAIKNTHLVGRLAVYSKKPEDTSECLRFILKESCCILEEVLEKIPPVVRDAIFRIDEDETLGDFLVKLGSIKSDNVSYFYSTVTCEGLDSHCMAVVHEFGNGNNPYCVCTSYFRVDIGK